MALALVPSDVSPASVAPSLKEGTWPGGFWRDGARGRAWFIRQRVGEGARIVKALGVLDANPAVAESRAMAEWTRFKDDPAGYRTPKERAADLQVDKNDEVRLDVSTLEAFLDRCRELVEKDELSAHYVRTTLTTYLVQWGKALGNRDLHKVTLDDLQRLLARKEWQTAQHKRIVALKSFTAWARTEKPAPKLRREQDPTIDLTTPPVKAAKNKKAKGYPVAFVEEVYRHIPDQTVRDMIRLRATANGMHDTEIDRLAQGKGTLRKIEDPSGIYGVLEFFHAKKDEHHSISVDKAAFEAAERLQTRGGAMAKSRMLDILDAVAISMHGCGGVSRVVGKRKNPETAKRAGKDIRRVEPCPKCRRLLPNELRHSFVTWASTVGELVHPTGQKGIPLDLVAQGMGHTKSTTTKRFYLGQHVPPMYRVPVKLEHSEDPK